MAKLVVGLGDTGLSILQFLKKKGIAAIGYDTRAVLSQQKQIESEFAIPVLLGSGKNLPWQDIDELLVSPGVDLQHPVIIEAKQRGLPVYGDIELFYREAKAPIIAITGTNAKSTVTTLVTEMINATGKKALMGGNIGTPALALLEMPVPDFYVLELSSFQLDLVDQFRALVAIVLNISPDHLDRHTTMAAYQKAKERIYQNCVYPVKNQGPGILPFDVSLLSPGLAGEHNLENARNALAITAPLNLPLAPQLEVLKTFKSLPHRCVLVRILDGVAWYNDSKGTNVGATLAAIKGIGAKTSGRLIILLGGVAKDQDFSSLRDPIAQYGCDVIVYGRDQDIILRDLQGITVPLHSTQEALPVILQQARSLAKSGDAVLFSPACASFDTFKNFEDRGEQFTRIVEAFNKTE